MPTEEQDVAEDAFQEMSKFWRKLRRGWQNVKSGFRNRRAQMSRAAYRDFLDRMNHDPDFDRQFDGVDRSALYQQVDQERGRLDREQLRLDGPPDLSRELNEDLEAEAGRQRDLDAERQLDDRDGDGVYDPAQRQAEDLQTRAEADQTRAEQEQREAQAAQEQAEREQRERAEEQRRQREEREGGRAPEGTAVAGTAAAAGAAAALTGEAVDRVDDNDALRADNQQQAQAHSELEADQATSQPGTAEVAADGGELNTQLRDEIQQDIDAQQVADPVIGAEPESTPREVDELNTSAVDDQGVIGVGSPEQGQEQEQEQAPEAERDVVAPAVIGEPDRQEARDQDLQYTDPDGIANQEALAGRTTDVDDRAAENAFDNDPAEQPGTRETQEEAEQLEAASADDGQFVNADGTANQAALNGEFPEQETLDAEERQERDGEQVRTEQQLGEASTPTFPTAGDQAAAAAVREQNANTVETDQDGQTTTQAGLDGQMDPVERVLKEDRDRYGQNGQRNGAGGSRALDGEDLRKVAELRHDGGDLPLNGAARGSVEVGSGARESYSRTRQQQVTAGRARGGEDGGRGVGD